jgi:hypothetical protein
VVQELVNQHRLVVAQQLVQQIQAMVLVMVLTLVVQVL